MTADALVERCRALEPILASEAMNSASMRRVSDTAMDAVNASGIRGAMTPRSLGGDGLGLAAMCDATRILSRGCPASGWTISFLMLHSWFLAKLPEAGRQEVFSAGPGPGAACPLFPPGSITTTGDGYAFSGRWPYATAVRHSEWVMIVGIITDTLTPLFGVCSVDEVDLADDWRMSGMQATGSETVTARNVVIPATRTIDPVSLYNGSIHVDGDGMDGIPLLSVLALTASAVSLGAAQAAVQCYRQQLETRRLAYTAGVKASDQTATRMRLASIVDACDAAIHHHRSVVNEIVERSNDGRASEIDRVRARLGAAATVRASRAVVAMVCEGAGASVYREDHPIQRIQRDVETLKGHAIFDWDRATELAGRVMLGEALTTTDMA
jgi:alkylation response protein AidB-like acyl-CoA dehydrogenase